MGALAFGQVGAVKGQSLAPYVGSPVPVVERMLEMANLKTGETVYDLGCGDGRILIVAAQKHRVKAVGVELSERLAKSTTESLKKLGLSDLASVIHGDLMDVNLSDADVVTIYLLRDSNDLLRPKLEKSLRPGARIVSHDYEIRGWRPTAVERLEASKREHKIYVYTVPESFAKK
jgi:protein-L-isoaspartate O-methyltransferase